MKERLVDDLIDRTLQKMTAEERLQLVLSVVERMLGAMGREERLSIMQYVVDHFLDGLADEERQAAVRDLVPRLLAQLMQSGGMNVDELLWAAMGSLGALEAKDQGPATQDSKA